MSARIGRITARLAEPIISAPPDLIDRINRNVGPPTPVRAEDVHVRAMFIVSDQVNSFGGCFPVEEHRHLAELLVDSPVLVGHRKDKLPVARTFHAVTLEQAGEHWVKAYFYWPRSAARAEDLRENIDGGIYKECSIGFTFALAECSICGRDIRLCEHEPFQAYTANGREQECHFRYRRIERVLESSLVYRGATPDTFITRELEITPDSTVVSQSEQLTNLAELAALDPCTTYLVMPRYAHVPCTLACVDGSVQLSDATGKRIDCPSLRSHLEGLTLPEGQLEAALVGYRGKERCAVEETERLINGEHSKVRRLVLYLIPKDQSSPEHLQLDPDSPLRVVPHRFTTVETLLRCAREITTREGVEIRAVPSDGEKPQRFLAHPDQLDETAGDHYRLYLRPELNRGILSLAAGQVRLTFALHQFNRTRLDRGKRFLADPVPSEAIFSGTDCMRGSIRTLEKHRDAVLLQLAGPMPGAFVLRPITLNGRKRFLFYKAADEGGQHHGA